MLRPALGALCSTKRVMRSERSRWLLRLALLLLAVPIGWGIFQGVRSTRLKYQLVACRDDSLVIAATTTPFTWSIGSLGCCEAPFPQSAICEWRWQEDRWWTRVCDETWTGDVYMPDDRRTLLYARHPRTLVLADFEQLAPRQLRSLGGDEVTMIAGMSANGRYAMVEMTTAVPGLAAVIDTRTLQDSQSAELQAGVVDRLGHRIRPCLDDEKILVFEVGDIETGRVDFRRVTVPGAVDQMMSTYVAGMSAGREFVYWVNMSRVHSVHSDAGWRTIEPTVKAVYDHAFHEHRQEMAMAGLGAVDLLDCRGGQAARRLVYEGEFFTRVAYSPNGQFLAALSDTGTAVVWDAERGQIVADVSLPQRAYKLLALWLIAAALWCGAWLVLSIRTASSWIASLDVVVVGVGTEFAATLAAMLEYAPWYPAVASYSATVAAVLLVATTLVLTTWMVGGNGSRFARIACGMLGLGPLWGGLAFVMKRAPIVENTNIILYSVVSVLIVCGSVLLLRFRGWTLVHGSESRDEQRMWQWSVKEWFLATAVLGGALVACRDLAPPDVPAPLLMFAAILCVVQAVIVLTAIWSALSDARMTWRCVAILAVLPLSLIGPACFPGRPNLPLVWYLSFQGGIGVGVFVMLYLFRLRGFRIRNQSQREASEVHEPIPRTTSEIAEAA